MPKIRITDPITGRKLTIKMDDPSKLTSDFVSKVFAANPEKEPESDIIEQPASMMEQLSPGIDQEVGGGVPTPEILKPKGQIGGPLSMGSLDITKPKTDGSIPVTGALTGGFAEGLTMGAINKVPGFGEELAQVREERPIASTIGNIAGSIVSGGALAKGAKMLGMKVAPSMVKGVEGVMKGNKAVAAGLFGVEGAGESFVESVMSGDKGKDIVRNTIVGAGLGTGGKFISDKLGSLLENVSDRNINKFVQPKETKRIKNRFGNKLDEIAEGAYGKNATEVYQGLDAKISSLDDELATAIDKSEEASLLVGKTATKYGIVDEMLDKYSDEIFDSKIPGLSQYKESAKKVVENLRESIASQGIDKLTPKSIHNLKKYIYQELNPFDKAGQPVADASVRQIISERMANDLLAMIKDFSPNAKRIGEDMNKYMELRKMTGQALDAGKDKLHISPIHYVMMGSALPAVTATGNPAAGLPAAIYGALTMNNYMQTLKGVIKTRQAANVIPQIGGALAPVAGRIAASTGLLDITKPKGQR